MKFIAWLDHPPWLDYNLFVGYLLNTTIGYLMVGYHLSGYHFSGYSAIGYHVAGYHITGYLTLRKTREMFLAGAVDSRIQFYIRELKENWRKDMHFLANLMCWSCAILKDYCVGKHMLYDFLSSFLGLWSNFTTGPYTVVSLLSNRFIIILIISKYIMVWMFIIIIAM